MTPDGRNGTALINQDAFFSISKLETGISVEYKMNLKNNGVYIHCAAGAVEIGSNRLESGDAIGVYDTESIPVKADSESELIFVEVPMQRGNKI